MSAATLCTRLVSLYAFIRFFADEGVMSPELLRRKIYIKLPIKLPKSIEADDEERIIDGKLYLTYDKGSAAELEEIPGELTKAKTNWPKVKAKLAQ